MNTRTINPFAVLGALALGIACWAPVASAQEHLVALGRVSSTATIVNSANTVGGAVAGIHNGTGDYTITVSAPGAFAGTGITDYVAQVTHRSQFSGDRIAKVDIAAVSPDVLSLNVHIDDVEDSTDVNSPFPVNAPFFFSIYRIPDSFEGKGSTKFLLSTGRVAVSGALLSAFTPEGLEVSSTRPATGDYEMTFTNPGAFAGMGVSDFVPILSLRATGNFDEAIRGQVTSVTNDTVTLRVRTDDVQDLVDDDLPVPTNRAFHYTLYQIPLVPDDGPAKSQALTALGRVTSSGNLVNGGTFGGSLETVRNDTGDYTLTLTKPGAFEGRSETEFAAQVHLRRNSSDDMTIGASIVIDNPSVMRIRVFIADVEPGATNSGVPTNRPFYFLVYDAVAAYQPDLQIGRRRSLTIHRGDGIYNNNGAGQSIRVRMRDRQNGATRKKGYFFLAENDGNVVDNLRLRTNKSGRHITTRYFRIIGGRQNVTAALTAGTLTLDDLRPEEQVRFRAVTRFRMNTDGKIQRIAHRARSLHDGTKRDTVRATLIRVTR